MYDFDFFVQELQAGQDASQRLSGQISAEQAIRSQLFQLAETDAERLVYETDVRSMRSLQLEGVVHVPHVFPAFMARLQLVDFLVDGKFAVKFGVLDIDLEDDEVMFLLVISAEPDGRCGSES